MAPPADAAPQARSPVVAVIPAFNEAVTIADVVCRTLPCVDALVVVDDGSADATATLAREAGARVVVHGKNQGKGAALRTGFREAATHGAAIVVTLDGDGQHDPAEIPLLVEPIRRREARLVVGSRRLASGARSRIPAHRRFGQGVAALVWRLFAGARLTDTASGFRAYDALLLRELAAREDRYAADWELLFEAILRGASIREVPITVRYDVPAPSKHSALRHLASATSGIARTIARRRPFWGLAVPALLLAALALLLGIPSALAGGLPRTIGGIVGAVAALGSLAVSLLLLGLFARSWLRRTRRSAKQARATRR